MKGLGRTSFIPGRDGVSGRERKGLEDFQGLTVLEVHRDVVAADVRRHGDDGGVVELADEVGGGDAVQIGHDDVHEHEVVFRAGVEFVHCLQAIQGAVDVALECVQELPTDASARLVVFHEENLRLAAPAWIHGGALLTSLRLLQAGF